MRAVYNILDGSEVVELPTSCSAPPVAAGGAGGAAGASVGPARTSEGEPLNLHCMH